ncbi:MAG: serine hydrolase [Woeseiaceae bacterium]|nr:serine hydrolase [Woeseiaceae bacterium]
MRRSLLPLLLVLLPLQPTAADSLADAVSDLDLPPALDAALVVDGEICGLGLGAGDDVSYPRFHAASITKLITTIAVFRLVEAERLRLEDRVGDYVEGFEDSPITIEQLLTHTSGLRDSQRADGRVSREDVDKYVGSLSRQRTAGRAKWLYADANFNLLGRVIEEVADRPYADFVDDAVLDALDMGGSTFTLFHIPDADRVPSFDKRGRSLRHPWDRAFLPSSGLQTTAGELMLFADAILDIADGATDGVVQPASLRTMTTEVVDTNWNGVAQGYGWQLATSDAGRVWRHAGGEAGFESLLTIYPEKGLAIAVLGNRKDWPRFELERRLREWALNNPGACRSADTRTAANDG